MALLYVQNTIINGFEEFQFIGLIFKTQVQKTFFPLLFPDVSLFATSFK